MENRKKIKILSWTLIFILIINISAIGTLVYKHNQFVKKFENNHQFGTKHPRIPREPLKLDKQRKDTYKNFLIKEIDLSPQQQKQFDKIRDNFIIQTHSYFDSIHYYNDLIDNQIKYEIPDTNLINKYSSKIGVFHKTLKIRYIKYNLQIKNILNKKQKKEYFDAFIKFRSKNFYHEQKRHKNKQ